MIVGTTLAATAALGLWAGWIEPRSLRVRRHVIPIPGLAAPLRAVAISDLQPWLHHWPAERLRAAFARAAAERPDIVFWLGDYYNEPTVRVARWLDAIPAVRRLHDRIQTPMAAIAAEMGRLTAPMGAYAVLGNHDWAWDGAACAESLRSVGVTPLIGECAVAEHPTSGARLTVIGLDDVSSNRPHCWERLRDSAGGPSVLLTHSPDVWAEIEDAPALALAGHSHGGQFAPPFFGPPWLTAHGRIYPRGWHERGESRLCVTVGMGASGVPLRLGVPPEILSLELRPA